MKEECELAAALIRWLHTQEPDKLLQCAALLMVLATLINEGENVTERRARLGDCVAVLADLNTAWEDHVG